MALIRWEPAREIQSLQQEVNRLFGTFFDAPAGEAGIAARRWVPAMDLLEQEDHYVLKADLPGLTDKDVDIEVEDRVLTVSGKRSFENEQRKDGYYRIERAGGSFSRSLTLPEGVDPQAIEATVEHGVLEVRIPKPAERKPTRVAIKAGGSPEVVEGEPAEAA